ncbi:hypothetical protein [Glycomyces harbinensis]|uniref:HNH endonuclease n=1 Tax=Glycomyces harbinensis TaxID=58114 RepID=A0A1G6Y8C4_9ACTN|nr:hypothetical protein [Glycomyces harbinensis]SDD86511.1 hypothetical protein SAMN05216270_108189 [Glycomyces harbinensis]
MKRIFKSLRRWVTRPDRPKPAESKVPAVKPMVDSLPIGPGLIYPDVLPENVWGSNLRGILPRADWDRLRIPVCEAAGMRCEVCGQPGHDPQTGRPRRPDCHEIWHFEVTSTTAVQRLARLIALCVDCHRLQHIGLANLRGEESLVKMQLKAVNAWSNDEIDLALENAAERLNWRSRYNWDLDLSLLAGKLQIRGYPCLVIAAKDRRRLGNSYFTR